MPQQKSYNTTTDTLKYCYRSLTILLQKPYNTATKALQYRYRSFTIPLQKPQKNAIEALQEHYRLLTRALQMPYNTTTGPCVLSKLMNKYIVGEFKQKNCFRALYNHNCNGKKKRNGMADFII